MKSSDLARGHPGKLIRRNSYKDGWELASRKKVQEVGREGSREKEQRSPVQRQDRLATWKNGSRNFKGE